jgi:hypothetical protein
MRRAFLRRKGMSDWIPKLTDERLAELVEKIKPVIRRDDDLYYIKPVDPRGIAYTWDPKPTEAAEELVMVCDITTFHGFAHQGCFKPSIAEVLSQIPKGLLDLVIAFEIVKSPEDINDLNRFRVAMNEGYHVARTRLYTAPEICDERWFGFRSVDEMDAVVEEYRKEVRWNFEAGGEEWAIVDLPSDGRYVVVEHTSIASPCVTPIFIEVNLVDGKWQTLSNTELIDTYLGVEVRHAVEAYLNEHGPPEESDG